MYNIHNLLGEFLMFGEHHVPICTFLKMIIIMSLLVAKNTPSSPTSVTVPFLIMLAFVCCDKVTLKKASKALIY